MTPSVPIIASSFAPIGLQEMDAGVALQDRIDRKYVVSVDALEAIADRLSARHRILEIDGERQFEYCTAYFDSPTLASYREHLQGRRRRFKCRSRRYGATDRCVFEVKLKGARGRTVKHAIDHPAAEHGLLTEPARAFVRECLARAYDREPPEDLGPVLAMSYRRVTLVAPGRGERLTCDFALRFDGGGRLAERFAIVECKSATGSTVAGGVLRELGAREVAGCSKYCLGIALTRPEVTTNALRPLLRRYFEPDAAPPAVGV